MENKEPVSAILLAAGKSSRMGSPKLLLPLANSTIFETTLDHLRLSRVSEVVVVVGANAERMKELIGERPVKVVVNPRYAEGMSTSLICGLAEVRPESRWVLIALGDKPLVDTSTYNQLIEASKHSKRGIIVPTYRGMRGTPTLVLLTYRNELLELRGDVGGRSLLECHPEDVYEVEVDCPGVLEDVNTPEDYIKLIGGSCC